MSRWNAGQATGREAQLLSQEFDLCLKAFDLESSEAARRPRTLLSAMPASAMDWTRAD